MGPLGKACGRTEIFNELAGGPPGPWSLVGNLRAPPVSLGSGSQESSHKYGAPGVSRGGETKEKAATTGANVGDLRVAGGRKEV